MYGYNYARVDNWHNRVVRRISYIHLTNVVLLQMGGCRKSRMCEIYNIKYIIMCTFHTRSIYTYIHVMYEI